MRSTPAPRWQVPALTLVGLLLAQTAWIFAITPFAGIDEPDQAFRADAVAGGEWLAHGTAPGARGGLVTVRRDVVDAAHRQCAALPYNHAANCRGPATADGEREQVAAATSRYHPVFYWLAGKPAQAVHGTTALYVMRITSALMCALVVLAAVLCLRRAGGQRWAVAGFVLAGTPVLVYATTLPAPNGLEMSAGLLLWCALLAVRPDRRRGDGWVLMAGTFAGVLLVSLRSLGPLFALLIVACVVLLRRHDLRDLMVAHRRGVIAGAVVVGAAAAASVTWIAVSAPLGTHDGDPAAESWSRLLGVAPLALLQSVAAAPGRSNAAPIHVYPLYLLLIAVVLVLAWRTTRRSGRAALVVAVLLTQVVPLVVSAAGLRSVGLIWQGRYILPFAVGVLPLAGLLLDRSRQRLSRPLWIGVAVMFTLAQVSALLGAYLSMRRFAVYGADPSWWQLSPAAVGALMLLACAAQVAAVVCAGDGPRPMIATDRDDGLVSVTAR